MRGSQTLARHGVFARKQQSAEAIRKITSRRYAPYGQSSNRHGDCHASVTRRYYIGEKRNLPFFDRNAQCENCRRPPCHSLRSSSRAALPRAAETVTAQHRLQVTWARTDEELREAQRLRYRVFADEMGARLSGPAGLDVDSFDAYCDHLLVRDLDTLKVVGTYRVLPPHQAARIGRLYAESEFDVSRLTHLRAEDGRSGPLVRASRLSQRRGDHVAVGRPRRLHEAERLRNDARLRERRRWSTAATMRRICTLRCATDALTAPEYRAFPHTPLPVEELRTGAR